MVKHFFVLYTKTTVFVKAIGISIFSGLFFVFMHGNYQNNLTFPRCCIIMMIYNI